MLRFNMIVLTLILCCTTFLLADVNKINIEDILNDDSPIVRLRYPSLSPDGTKLAFSTQGDIWVANADGSDPRRVSAHPDREIKPIWLPNSKELLYLANYSGDYEIYRISIDRGVPTRLTHYQTSDYANDITGDGKYVIYYSTRDGRSDIFLTSTEKLTSPVRLMHTYWDSESMPTITDDMKHVAFEVNGTGGYHRPSYTGYGDAEIWMADFSNGELSNYRQLTDNMYADNSPKFIYHPKKQREVLLYSSYPSKNQKIHGDNGIFMIDPLSDEEDSLKPKLLIPSPITRFPLRAVSVVLIDDFWHITIENGVGGINYYIVNPETEAIVSQKMLDIDINPMQQRFLPELVRKTNSITEFAFSPDNRKVAAIHNGDVFVGALTGGLTEQLTFSSQIEMNPCWSKDSKNVYFVTLMNGNADIYGVNIQTGKLIPVVNTKHQEMMPTLTKDGKFMLYIRNDRDLRKRNLVTGEEVSIFNKGIFEKQGISDEPKYQISPSGKFVLFTPKMPNDLNANVWVASLDGKISPRQVTFFKSNAYNPCWSPDDLNIVFTAQVEHDWDIYAINFDEKSMPGFAEDGLDSLLGKGLKSKTIEEAKEKQQPQTQPQTQPKKPVITPSKKVNTYELTEEEVKKWTEKFDNAWESLNQVTKAETHEFNPVVFKFGTVKNVIYTIGNDFWSCSINGAGNTKLSTVAGNKGYMRMTDDGRYIAFVNSGRINRYDPKGKRILSTNLQFEYFIDPVKQRLSVYDEAVWVFENYYYSADKIREWMPAAKLYRRMIAGNSFDNEINAIYYELMGALNSSHTGYYGRSSSSSPDMTAEFGIHFDPKTLYEKGKFLITDIIDDTDTLKIGIKPGMYLLAVDGVELTPDVCIDQLLSWKTGKRVFLTLSEKENPTEQEKFTVKLRGSTRTSMWYKQRDNWLRDCKVLTKEWSKGDFGYIHIAGMNSSELLKLKRELNSFVNKDGFVLDMRGNTGGYTARDILEILYKEPFIMRSTRTFGRVSENAYRGYSWEKPVVLITDERSVSNAEIFSEGFQKLGIGPIVGMPTTGGVIGTSSYRLSDGTSIRLPGYGCYTVEDIDLEGNPRMPDVMIDRLYYASEYKDVQLEAAVRELRKHTLYFAIHNKRPYSVAPREEIEPELEKLYAEWLKSQQSEKK